MKSETNSHPCACCGRRIANKTGKRVACSRSCSDAMNKRRKANRRNSG